MRIRLMMPLLVLGLLASRAAAEEKADVKAIVEKAIKAHGGEENLAKYKAIKYKAKGKMSVMGADIEFSIEASGQLPDQIREDLKLDIMGNQLAIVQVFDGKNGWISNMGMTMEADETQLKQLKEQAYSNQLESLLPLLKDKKLELKLLEEAKVEGKAAAVIKVTSKGQKDIKMFFDKDSGLLVKTEYKSRDFMMQDVDAATFFHDYKDVNGIKQAMKQSVEHDGKKFMDAEVVEIKVLEKLDASTFEKP